MRCMVRADEHAISRGKFDRLPYAIAEFTTGALDGYGFAGHWPARPTPYASDPVLAHRLVSLLHASFRPSVARTPLRFARGLHRHQVVKGNLPPPSCRTCSAHIKKGP